MKLNTSERIPPSESLGLRAAFGGWAMPLAEIDDPVFAGGVLGGGIGIDPTDGVLCAPCAGVVTMLHRAHHALTIRAECGAEILLHVGLDTVDLGGAGFTPHVAEGQSVAPGDKLIGFDLDLLARRARSLVSPMIVTSEGWRIVRAVTGCVVRQGDVVLEIVPAHAAAAAEKEKGQAGPMLEEDVVVRLPGGFHARPAGLVAERARNFAADIRISAHDRSARATSPTSLMALGVGENETVHVVAIGDDAAPALAALRELLGRPDAGAEPASLTLPPPDKPASPPIPLDGRAVLRGVEAAPGIALGRTRRLARIRIEINEAGSGVAAEQANLRRALDEVAAELERAIASARGPEAEILRAHRAFLQDPDLLAAAAELIAGGKSAAFAFSQAVERQVAALQATGMTLIGERVADLRDVAHRVLLRLAGRAEEFGVLEPGTILIGRELLPSQLAAIDLARVAGICTAAGGPTSHVAVIAAAAGIPALVAVGSGIEDIEDGTTVLLDASHGVCVVDPSTDTREAAQARITAREAVAARLAIDAAAPCRTADGTAIEIVANLGALAEVEGALANGAEGCGLLRTEFLFLGRTTAPSEDDQYATYQAIATALGGRKLIIRTLDAGADKPLPYLGLAPETNPALGIRGIRIGCANPDMLRVQIRAILRVSPPTQCLMMVPMLATGEELRMVRAMLEEERRKLGRAEPLPLGIMIEIPSAALIAETLAADADFFSIGTNDLTQYTLAMDRGNPALASRIDALHPAVLRLIARACEGARAHGRWTGVCGGLASVPLAAPVLIGLGVSELSAVPAAIPKLKALIAGLTMAECRAVAEEALVQPNAAAVRALLTHRWPEA